MSHLDKAVDHAHDLSALAEGPSHAHHGQLLCELSIHSYELSFVGIHS